MKVDTRRIRPLNITPIGAGAVVYWMGRDQRAQDNWALLFAQEVAIERKEELHVVFCLVDHFLQAQPRHFAFMVEALRETALALTAKNIFFHLLTGNPVEEIPRFVTKLGTGVLVTDFDPLKIRLQWKKKILQEISCAMLEVDAHNIVPVWCASHKLEWAARTIRPKILGQLKDFLTPFPVLKKHPFNVSSTGSTIIPSKIVLPIKPGAKAGAVTLKRFIFTRLAGYSEGRNDPGEDYQSGLSPYFHFGQIAPQRAALEVRDSGVSKRIKDVFLEELIVRRELSDNYCLYNSRYDDIASFPPWAQKTLSEHARDKRPWLYTRKQFENAATHDEIWNAAQKEMVITGKMHGYLRMYWAKKILEWSKSPEEAFHTAIFLNDKYEMDGRDPNGYVGVAWSIGGVHDRPWFKHPVFGSIRFMSKNGLRTKFDMKCYLERISKL